MHPDPPVREPAGRAKPTAADVASLTASLSAVEAVAQALLAQVRQSEQSRQRTTRIMYGVLGLVAVLVIALLAVGWRTNQLTGETNRLTAEVAENNARVADCTTPGGKCYEQSRARTGEAIGAVVRISVLVAQCGRLYPGESGPEFDRKLDQCVAGRLTAATPGPAPTPSGAPSGAPPPPR